LCLAFFDVLNLGNKPGGDEFKAHGTEVKQNKADHSRTVISSWSFLVGGLLIAAIILVDYTTGWLREPRRMKRRAFARGNLRSFNRVL
jgi:hypothetical protein